MKEPNFWSYPPDKKGLFPILLSPLSMIYRWGSARRWDNGVHVSVPIPVICVGNITLGGTGKTPSVIYLAMRLLDMGHRPHIVTRGYKGSLQGPVMVSLTQHSADEVGDEPLLLAAFAPTHVAKDRAAGCNAAVQAGADVIILDDGMQNPAVAKDLTLMVVDGSAGFGNNQIFPAGPLRETLASGLTKAHAVLIIGQDHISHLLDDTPVINGSIDVLNTGMDWMGQRVLAFAGIGRPQKFYDSLKQAGADVVQVRSFGDHQKLPVAILKRLEAEAAELGAQLVTTEKDAARLPREWAQKVLTLPVRLNIQHPDKLNQLLADLFQ